MNTPDGYIEAATKAAERWKANQGQSPELKAQIIATWRLTKEYMRETQSSGIRIGQLQSIWQAAFKDVPSWDFDFTKDDRSEF